MYLISFGENGVQMKKSYMTGVKTLMEAVISLYPKLRSCFLSRGILEIFPEEPQGEQGWEDRVPFCLLSGRAINGRTKTLAFLLGPVKFLFWN